MKRITPKHELTIEERKQLLAKPTYNLNDVIKMTGYCRSKANQIMKTCKEKLNGKVLFNEHAITRNSLLAWLGTSLEQENYVIKQLETKEQDNP